MNINEMKKIVVGAGFAVTSESSWDSFYELVYAARRSAFDASLEAIEAAKKANQDLDFVESLIGLLADTDEEPYDDRYYGSPEHAEMGDAWYYSDCPGAW